LLKRRQGLGKLFLPLKDAAHARERRGLPDHIMLLLKGRDGALVIGQGFLKVILDFMEITDLQQLLASQGP
jgi:hypothetical protein